MRSGPFTAAVFVASDAGAPAGEEEAAAEDEAVGEEAVVVVVGDGVAGQRCSGVLWPAGMKRRALKIAARRHDRTSHQTRIAESKQDDNTNTTNEKKRVRARVWKDKEQSEDVH